MDFGFRDWMKKFDQRKQDKQILKNDKHLDKAGID